jgi:predicted Na+-dependent transporter
MHQSAIHFSASSMILIVVLWGVWDLLTGLILASIWSRYPRTVMTPHRAVT